MYENKKGMKRYGKLVHTIRHRNVNSMLFYLNTGKSTKNYQICMNRAKKTADISEVTVNYGMILDFNAFFLDILLHNRRLLISEL